MMKSPNVYFCFIFLQVLLLFSQRTFSQEPAEGLLSMRSFFTGFKDSAEIPFPLAQLESKVWYRDSCAILEIRVTHGRGQSGITKYQYELVKYTFLDLRKMVCQDYLVFSDTSTPFCNYILGRTDFLGGVNLWYPKDSTFNTLNFIDRSDTAINNITYKRVSRINSKTVPHSTYTYYFDCKAPQIPLILSAMVSGFFPGCPVRIIELDSNNDMKSFSVMEQVRSKLTDEENKIFDKWEANSKSTSIPLMKFNETIVECDPLTKEAIERLGP